ncbi:hypothetical protein [Methanoregula sp.]|uniref:hypothetical protein n=1 Tax=Methanoregula sp. TaxID=2052170 RepID=UPI0035617D7B
MTTDSGSDPSQPRRSHIVLSVRTKRQIGELIGKCEYCGTLYPADALDICQIGMLSGSPHRHDENPAHAIIVLCEEHSRQVHEGKILKSHLKSSVTKRPDRTKRELRELLQKHDRTYEGNGVREIRHPDRFGVEAFIRGKSGSRR